MAAVLMSGVVAARVEAATIAIIPLINKVEFQSAEEEQVPNQIFNNQALAVIKNKPGYMLVENERLRHAVKENIDPYTLPTKEQLAVVSKKGNVDIVLAMELTNYALRVPDRQGDTRMVIVDVRGNLASYNRLTGKYVIKRCGDANEVDETFTSRWDLVQEDWNRLVRQEIDRITRTKKK